ncbi:SOCG_00647-like, conserved protein [Schizosaccharomyces osmophilus]|uniref:SOCG_00647-like, conserved protein n=1 Tax=Schizosaccharomyces osmophilus TaxID=2545709 RepID=A0AAE9WCC1_9SCHI|nr:SOCG_00647-like, conserved protein [Schizosaccharomyces osmophilus]WBW73634.1 SOCG_00647-like, conserved protein [Schizosaccharomyces osmophilus]
MYLTREGLPEGWVAQWDSQYKCYFYVNEKSQNPTPQWESPVPGFNLPPPSSSSSSPNETTGGERGIFDKLRPNHHSQPSHSHNSNQHSSSGMFSNPLVDKVGGFLGGGLAAQALESVMKHHHKDQRPQQGAYPAAVGTGGGTSTLSNTERPNNSFYERPSSNFESSAGYQEGFGGEGHHKHHKHNYDNFGNLEGSGGIGGPGGSFGSGLPNEGSNGFQERFNGHGRHGYHGGFGASEGMSGFDDPNRFDNYGNDAGRFDGPGKFSGNENNMGHFGGSGGFNRYSNDAGFSNSSGGFNRYWNDMGRPGEFNEFGNGMERPGGFNGYGNDTGRFDGPGGFDGGRRSNW